MIRCIPVDGSEPFDVENDTALDRYSGFDLIIRRAARIADVDSKDIWRPRYGGPPVPCLVESWRERAERLEKELAELRQNTALDAMDKRREYEHP